MGIIYEAEREGIGGRAAIKVLRPEYTLQPDIVERFLNETVPRSLRRKISNSASSGKAWEPGLGLAAVSAATGY